MPAGKITKIVHLTLQSSGSADCSPAPKGYGYLVTDDTDANGEAIYFDAKAVQAYNFDDLQIDQTVEFDPDPKLPVAKSVRLVGEVLAPPVPQVDLP